MTASNTNLQANLQQPRHDRYALMLCICQPCKYRRKKYIFHWPNFTFSHSEYFSNLQRTRSTFSLKLRHKSQPLPGRRRTVHTGTALDNQGKSLRRKPKFNTIPSPNANSPTREMSDNYQPPPGPPPSYSSSHPQQNVSWNQSESRPSELSSNNPLRNAHMNPSQGLPQSNSQTTTSEFQPPPGPPPSSEFQPPPGPPPSHQQPPNTKSEEEPPPYDPWLAVPDSTFLPPPPSLREERSPTANATRDDAVRGHDFCDRTPLWLTRPLNNETLFKISRGDVGLTKPPNSPNAKHIQLSSKGPGRTRIKTSAKCTDTVFLSDVPLYSAFSPQNLQTPRMIYFEIRIIFLGEESRFSKFRKEEADVGITLGFLAPPYPFWRLPGWHRASLGVHGDDGRRYVDDSYGGLDFTSAFRAKDVIGIGMAFKQDIEIFLTRNGKREGSWNLHEERDKEQDGGNVFGLEGQHDLLAAVGCFGACEFEVMFRKEDWVFKPSM